MERMENTLDQENRMFEGYGSLLPVDAPAVGYEREERPLRGDDDPPTDDEATDDDQPAVSLRDAKTPREMIESTGAALSWSKDRISRVLTAIQPILKYISGGEVELYDVFSTAISSLPEQHTTEDIEVRFARLATVLEETEDKIEYLGPVFSLPDFEAAAEIELRDIERRRAGPNFMPGNPCQKCKSTKTIAYQKQTRSADEGVTIITKCHECGYQWAQYT